MMAGMPDSPSAAEPGRMLAELRSRTPIMVDQLAALVGTETPSSDLAACAAGAEVVPPDRGAGRRGSGRAGRRRRPHPCALALGRGWRARIALIGHVDTVWPQARWLGGPSASTPVAPAGTATGPGCFDMKAGIVQLLHAVAVLGDPAGIEILITTDEEVGSPTSRPLIEKIARRSAAALILEPSARGSVKIGRRERGCTASMSPAWPRTPDWSQRTAQTR